MRHPGVIATVVASLLLVACASSAREEQVIVLAASSLTDVLGDAAALFEERNPTVDVQLSFAGSTAIREQLAAGAPADLVVVASDEVMADMMSAGGLDEPVALASNVPALVVPQGNPGGVAGLADLADESLLVGLCRSAVPCGVVADQVLADAGVQPSVDSREPDVRALLSKVASGELDVGIVYASDTRSALDDLQVIELFADGPRTTVVAAVVEDAAAADRAAAVLALLASDEGAVLFADRDFRPAP